MLEVTNIEVDGFESAIRVMCNSMDSLVKSDSEWHNDPIYDTVVPIFIHDNPIFSIGPNDLDLMNRIVKAETDNRNFLRMITIRMDINAPLYWWKEFDTYKARTITSSYSAMHRIHEKEFEIDDFSHEHLTTEIYGEPIEEPGWVDTTRSSNNLLDFIVCHLNIYRELYLETKDKKYWWQMIQLLPSSYNQKRTVMLNYDVAATIYFSSKNHKLDEWHDLRDQLKNLPYFMDIFNLEN